MTRLPKEGERLPFVSQPRQVAWADCDPAGLIFFANAFRYAVEAEHDALSAAGAPPTAAVNLVRAAVTAEYLAPIFYSDRVVVEFGVTHIGQSSAHYVFRIVKEGIACVRGGITIVHVDSGQATALPARVREALSHHLLAA